MTPREAVSREAQQQCPDACGTRGKRPDCLRIKEKPAKTKSQNQETSKNSGTAGADKNDVGR